ncbi:hypothetical protein MVEG_10696 [Podila verticillata NRRL 6337]|nr:hypothetical protein MVEG_10696 [Podila verticillata NRRL 6337]
MAPFLDSQHPELQSFLTEDGKLLQLPAKFCPETGYMYIVWQDVQDALHGVSYVEYKDWRGNVRRILFMVDQYGEVIHPLRIRSFRKAIYRVIYHEHLGQLPPALEQQYLYDSWMDASQSMRVATNSESRIKFLEHAGNAEYHYSKLLKYLDHMREIRVKIEVDGKTEDQILGEFREYRQNASVCEYLSTCRDIVSSSDTPMPCRFLVLPADLNSWNDSDPTTHQFRLYFLCDFVPGDSKQSSVHQHRHLSNHPGYNLDRPQEFFQAFGGLTLTMLKMVRQGVSKYQSKIPPLDTFAILWNLDPEITSNRITKDTIGPLIDKSINYLQALPVSKCEKQYFWSMKNAAIMDFLVVPNGNNSLGGLFRSTISVNEQHWTCQQHGHQRLLPGTFEALVSFVQGCGGHIDIQRASLSIELRSRHQAKQLCILIKNTNQRMDISIKINWNASRRDLGDLLRDIFDTKVQNVNLDGVSQSMHPQGHAEYRSDIIANCISVLKGLGSVTLLNYPRPQEQYMYIQENFRSVYKLHLKQQQQVKTKHPTMELQKALSSFEDAAMASWGIDLLEVISERLQCFLAKAGYHIISTIGSYRRKWHGEFNITEGTLQELKLHEHWTRRPFVALEALRFLRTLKMDVDDLTLHREEIAQMLRASLQLQEVNISLQENCTLESIEKTIEMWQGRSSPLQLTLLEYDKNDRGHVIAQVIVSGHVFSHPGNSNLDFQESIGHIARSHKRRRVALSKIDFLQWNSDHISAPLTDVTASLLDMATERHPSVLTSFTLDISLLTRNGFFHIQNILRRSMLTQIHICCTAFDNASLSDFVRQVLLSIRWGTLQSVILSGAAMNEWIQVLAITETSLLDLQLQYLRIQGTGKQPIALSHTSVLYFHELLYLSPSMELVVENVCLQDKRDSKF